ncbi:APC family permease [Aciduricibacillus chroicocephali]|uniref:APC family permease n=1 Tax=Aciduricibacillus chroicocephali TaxID=3054939 RepID=A0ABY9KTJ8_9BACI|nr:APC family permease [Bacillaceae bacterium 44XB]
MKKEKVRIPNKPNRETLDKSLKPHWVWAIALGSSIGWGAFVQPTTWMGEAGPLGVMVGFGIGAVLMMLIAVSYGFLIHKFPVSGGEFAYAFIGMGRKHAFFCSWFLTFGYICIVALNASAFVLMIKFLFPSVIENLRMYELAGWNVYLPEILIAVVLLAIFGYLNTRGGGLSGSMQFIFCVIMIAGVAAIAGWLGASPNTDVENLKPLFTPDKAPWAAILSIVAIAPWAFVGFDNIPQAAEEFNFSSKKAFGLIIFALIVAALLYSVMIFAAGITAPWQKLSGSSSTWATADAIKSVVGTGGVAILAIALVMGIFTGLNGFILSASRLLFAMSRAKVLPSFIGKTSAKHGTPKTAVIITVAIAMIAPFFGRQVLLWIVDMSSIGVSIAYFYTSLTAYKLFTWSEKDAAAGESLVASPIKKGISGFGAIASIGFILLLLIPGSPAFMGKQAFIALIIWAILGIVFYMAKRKEYNAISHDELSYLILGKKLDLGGTHPDEIREAEALAANGGETVS